MIIECTNCHKKFNVDPVQIPNSGRNIQCGTCDYIWFYKHEETLITDKIPKNEQLEKKDNLNIEVIEKTESENNKVSKYSKTNKSKELNFSKFLSFLIVIIISFVALIIILDTFKSKLIDIYPGIELILFNLFESIKDIILFFKNLIE